MRNSILTKTIAALLVVFALSFAAMAQTAEELLANGIENFNAGKYPAAVEQFKRADSLKPNNVPIKLWLGLALVATDDQWTAQDVWRAAIGDPKYESIGWFFKGLTFWRYNNKTNAAYYFKEVQPNAPAYKIAQQYLAKVNAGEDVPQISEWSTISGLLSSAKPEKNTASQKDQTKESKQETTAKTEEKAGGATPRGGLWRGTVTNQKGDQTITFRISADGSTLSDVTFQGYWRCKDAFNPTQTTNLAPPGKFVIEGGSFADTRNDKPSRMWWEFKGNFASAMQANGSLQIAFAGGECDSYRLDWTAKRVGN